jgi:hypothetical protein
MFAAGRESKVWTVRCWQAVAAVAAVVATTFAYLYLVRPPQTIVIERPVVIDPTAPKR